jgi:hypothetical protein
MTRGVGVGTAYVARDRVGLVYFEDKCTVGLATHRNQIKR